MSDEMNIGAQTTTHTTEPIDEADKKIDHTNTSNKKKKLTLKEQLKNLTEKEKRLEVKLEKTQAYLTDTRRKIDIVKKEVIGLEFLSITPDEFLKMSDDLQMGINQKVPVGEILKLLAEGNFEKLQKMYSYTNKKG